MASPTDRLNRVARRVARRAFIADLLRRLGPALTVAAGLGLALVILDKLMGWRIAWAILLGVPVAGGLAWAVGSAVAARWSELRAAGELDRALGLKDRISTALSLKTSENQKDNNPFVAWAIEDGEQAASKADHRTAVPVRIDWTWAAWPVLGALGVLAALYLPWMAVSEPEEQAPSRLVSQEEASDRLKQAREELQKAIDDASAADLLAERSLRDLEDLERQLQEGRSDPEQVTSRASRSLEDASRRLENEARRMREADQTLRNRLSEMDSSGLDSELMQRFAEQLQSGDFEGAQQTAQQLRNEASEMSAEERAQLAQQMRRLAEQLQDEQDRAQEQADQRRTENDLREQGISEDAIEQMQDMIDEQDIQECLMDEGMDAEQARRMAERLARENRERQAEEEAERDRRDLRESMEEAANEVEEQEQQEPHDHEHSEESGDCESGECTTSCPDCGGEGGQPGSGGGEGGQQQEGQKGESGMDRLERTMDRMSKRRQQAQECEGSAQSLRQQAQRMLDEPPSSPGSGSQQQARSDAPGSGLGTGEGEVEPRERDRVDASDPSTTPAGTGDDGRTPDRVVGHMPSLGDRPRDAEAQRLSPSEMREAARTAERAIEDQAVPQRFNRLLRRVYQRYEDRADTEGGSDN